MTPTNYMTVCLMLIFVFVLFTVNFLALAIALNCNRDKPNWHKLFVGTYAFLFGFIYIFVNYYSYRLVALGDTCDIDPTNIFPI